MAKSPAGAWVLLDRHPKLAAAAGDLDLQFELQDPPLRSTAKIRRGVLPPECHDIYIAAVEPTGRFVVCATATEQTSQGAAMAQHPRQVLFFCNGTDGTVRQLPAIKDVAALHHGSIGVVAAPDGDYLVAGLHADGADQPVKLYWFRFRTKSEEDDEGWMQAPVNLPLEAHHPWRGGTTVIAHDSKLLWVDVSTGILYCDPFAKHPGLLHVSLPQTSDLPGAPAHKRRCLQVSRGKIRFIVLEGENTHSAVIKSWTFSFDHIGPSTWKEGYELPFAQIQIHPSFRQYRSSKGMPNLEFIHPYERNVVFLTLDGYLFAVNLATAEITMSDKSKKKDDILDIIPLSLNRKPWTMVTSPVKIENAGSSTSGNTGFQLHTYGGIPHITSLCFDEKLINGFKIDYAYIAAAHPSGALLICAGYERLKLKKGQRRLINGFFVAKGTELRRLPILSADVCHHGTAGLSVDSKGIMCVAVLHLQQVANIYYWSSEGDDKWEKFQVELLHTTTWNADGVICQGSKLCWCDLSGSCALIFSDPFVAREKLKHLSLPQGSSCIHDDSMVTVSVSCSLIRLAKIDGPVATPFLKRWTLTPEMSWSLDFQLDLGTVWNSERYIATGLCTKQIAFLLITHPWIPNVTYFMKGKNLIGISSAGEVLEVEDFVLPTTPASDSKSPLVHWCDTSLKALHLLPALDAPQLAAEERDQRKNQNIRPASTKRK